jgi:hypothetical protein
MRDRDRNVCDAPGRPKPPRGGGGAPPPERDVDLAQERMDKARDEPKLEKIERPPR